MFPVWANNHLHCVILLASIPSIGYAAQEPFSTCYCAVFIKGANTVLSRPLVQEKLPILMDPGIEGRWKCRSLCSISAAEVSENAPIILCEALKLDVDNLKVAIYSRLLGEAWTFTGKADYLPPLCCRDGYNIPCYDVAHTTDEEDDYFPYK